MNREYNKEYLDFEDDMHEWYMQSFDKEFSQWIEHMNEDYP